MVGDPRSYKPYDFDPKVVNEFIRNTYGTTLTVHMPYIINPCEGNGQRKSFYTKTFKSYVEVAQTLGAKWIVMHPGFRKELSELDALDNLVRFVSRAWEEDYKPILLLETDAGSKNGSAVGSPEFIVEAMNLCEVPMHMCLDTTHMYARGVDLWHDEIREDFLLEYGHHIKNVHMNVPDLKVTLGSHLDRHNTPFEDRPGWNHEKFIQDLARYPMILERSSLAVQEKDNNYIRNVLGQPLERQSA